MTLQEMREFVDKLAKQERISLTWIYSHRASGYAMRDLRFVNVYMLNGEFTKESYWTALHEIGHVVNLPLPKDPETYISVVTELWPERVRFLYEKDLDQNHALNVMYCEVDAWKYALGISPEGPNLTDIAFIYGCLNSYAYKYGFDNCNVWEYLGLGDDILLAQHKWRQANQHNFPKLKPIATYENILVLETISRWLSTS
jgi:hypothetical protein